MKTFLYFIIFSLLLGCSGQSQKNSKQSESILQAKEKAAKGALKPAGLPVIDLKEKYLTKTIPLQEIADIEYIPMETRPDVLLGPGAFLAGTFFSDSLIITYSYDGGIFVYNQKGKNKNTFNYLGRGPGEYQKIMDMAVDFAVGEIYVLDMWSNWRILIYTLDGTFKKVLKLPNKYKIFRLFNYDENFLLCYEGYGVEWRKEEKFNQQPYALISKKDGRIIPFRLNLPERISATLHRADMPNVNFTIGASPLIKRGNEFLVSDFAQDTVYRLKDGVLSPYLLKFPESLWKLQIPIVARVKFASQRFTMIESIVMQVDKDTGIQMNTFTYDNQTGEVFKSLYINNDYEPVKEVIWNNFRNDLPLNYACIPLYPVNLIEAYEEGHLKGKLKEIASHLDEDANPVLMLIKFKE